jgi:hypothetical protein
MFDNNAVAETHNNLRDSVERVHSPINNGEFLGNEWPPVAKSFFELWQNGVIEVAAGQCLAAHPGQGGSEVGKKARIRCPGRQIKGEMTAMVAIGRYLAIAARATRTSGKANK